MALNTIADLSVTPASNVDLLGQSTSGTQSVSALDNMIRNHAAIHARAYLDQGGVVTVGGSANAITVTSNSTYQSLTNGLTVSFKAASANTGATTLNLDSLGAKAVRRQGDSALLAGDIVANGTYRVRYDTAYNGAVGAWVLLNPGPYPAKGADVASAATVSLGEGDFFHITGTTAITDIDFATPKDGRGAWLEFDGALTLTYNATTLTLPGGANITTAAGDRAYVVQDNGDNVHVLAYQKADGTAVVAAASGGMTLLGTLTTTSGTTQSLTGIASGYRELYFEVEGVSFAASGTPLTLALSSTNGSAYGTAVNVVSQALVAAANTWSGVIRISNISSTLTAGKSGYANLNESGTGRLQSSLFPATDTAAAVNAIQFAGGTFDAGSIRVYGVK